MMDKDMGWRGGSRAARLFSKGKVVGRDKGTHVGRMEGSAAGVFFNARDREKS